MDTMKFMNYTIYGVIIFMFGSILFMIVGGSLSNVGRTQAVGYVVNVKQATFPFPHTRVTFTIEHPTSIVEATYFSRTYYGYHEFNLHERTRVTAERNVFEYFPRIIEVEMLE